jgi:hypothetical protein
MARRAAPSSDTRHAELYGWLRDREELAAQRGGCLRNLSHAATFRSNPDRLAALRAGQPVHYALSDLPDWARRGLDRQGLRWPRAVVDRDGRIELRDETAAEWLADNGL